MGPLNRRDRGIALALTLAAVTIVVVLSARIHYGGAPPWIDTRAWRVANWRVLGIRLFPLGGARLVVALGETPAFAVMAGCVVMVALALRDRMIAVVAVIACPLAVLTTEVIGKPLVGRRELGPPSFPSGHATAMATIVTLVLLVVYRRWRERGLVAVAPVALLVPAMAVALVRAQDHFFSDTVAGSLIGMGTVLGLAWLCSTVWALRRHWASGDGTGRDAALVER